MFDVEVQDLTLPPSFVKDDLDALEKLYLEVVQQTKDEIISALSLALLTWSPEPEVLVRYPFFKDRNKLLSDYQEVLSIKETKGVVSLVVDVNLLKRKGLPENLPSLLEYGNEQVPPLPHIRPVLISSRSPISLVSHRLKEEL